VLAGAAGADDDPATEQVGRTLAASQHLQAALEDLPGLGQAPLAAVGAGQTALRGLQDDHATSAQDRDVGLGRGVLPHLGVHGGCQHHRAACGEQRAGQQVVGEPVRGSCHQVGRRRRHHDQVRLLAEPDVRHLVHCVPDLARDRLAREGGPGRCAHELERGGGGYDGDVVAGLGEATQQLAGLVGGDAT